MKLFIASDHAGFELKKYLFGCLEEKGITVVDKGPFALEPDDDYPDWVSLVASEVSRDPENARGIIIGLSGQGEAMVANRYANVRAGVFYGGSHEVIKLIREHNDTNVLSLGAKFLSREEAERVVDVWLETKFSGNERHLRRIKKIEEHG